jgi:hypothetical protein
MTDAAYLERVERGIAKATDAAPPTVKDEADRILRHLLTTNRKAHSGMFWAYVNDHEPQLYEVLRRRSYMVNGRWKEAAKHKLCRQTTERMPTWLASAHQKNTVWESLIYKP